MVTILFYGGLRAAVSDLAELPDWEKLNPHQKTITKEAFLLQLKEVYCPRESWWGAWIEIEENRARIRKNAGEEEWYDLYFADTKQDTNLSSNLWQHTLLSDLRIVLDPGHIGGKFARMEGRHFIIKEGKPVREGELSLQIASRIRTLLKREGAEVFLTRESLNPVTKQRPIDFNEMAKNWVRSRFPNLPENEEEFHKWVRKRSELLFYRLSEIMARSEVVEKLQPDLVLCIHLNAAPWADPDKKELVDRNDFHVLVNGCYMGGEIAYDNQRFEMFERLLNGWSEVECSVAEEIAISFAEKTRLPAFAYKGPNALKVGDVPGVWARNLLANRIYSCPVVFLEPYIANSKEVYQRILLGDYEDEKMVLDKSRQSLINEYAHSVVEGIKQSLLRAE